MEEGRSVEQSSYENEAVVEENSSTFSSTSSRDGGGWKRQREDMTRGGEGEERARERGD